MSESDGKVNAAYRSLAREEPPASLDAAILAASRNALVKPSASRRWAAPVSIAAVLVLALGVTLRMQQEQPGIESPDMDAVRREAPPPPAMKPQVAEERPAEREAPKVAVPQRAVPQHDAPKPAVQQAAPVPEKKVAVPQAKPDVAEADRAFSD